MRNVYFFLENCIVNVFYDKNALKTILVYNAVK